MHSIALDEPEYRVDAWLKNVVAGVIEHADVVRVERSELWSLLDNLPAAILISTDRSCSRIVGNIAAGAMLGSPLGSNLSQSAPPSEKPPFLVYADGDLVHPDDLPMQRAALTGRRVGHSKCEIRFEDGRRIFIAGHCIPITDDSGEVCGSIGAFVDVTEQHMRQERDALVAREMTHRVKNTVSLIQGLAHSTVGKKLSKEDYKGFEQRLINLAKAQDLIAKTQVGQVTLEEVIRSAIEPVAGEQLVLVKMDGPEIPISADLMQPLAMVFHELTTNACKYGALGNDGTLSIAWSTDGNCVTLSWRETGIGAPTKRDGFGSTLIRGIFRNQAMGKFKREFESDEMKIDLTFANDA